MCNTNIYHSELLPGVFLDHNRFAGVCLLLGYDMSMYVRRYAKYLNEKAFSYRQMAFDFCKVKRGFAELIFDFVVKIFEILQNELLRKCNVFVLRKCIVTVGPSLSTHLEGSATHHCLILVLSICH